MTTSDDDAAERDGGQYASPPCFMHEIDPLYAGLPLSKDAPWPQVAAWRKAERERLIALRLEVDAATRADHAERIARGLDALIGDPAGRTVSTYWPFRGEPNLLAWLKALADKGARTALPVVVAKGEPLVFRLWREGDKLARGVWNIPYPETGEQVEPDIVIAPVVGFDQHCYRLGYGGGFFDRTLASLPAATIGIGVGYALCAIPTIHPQSFDIPMRHIVTEAGVTSR